MHKELFLNRFPIKQFIRGTSKANSARFAGSGKSSKQLGEIAFTKRSFDVASDFRVNIF